MTARRRQAGFTLPELMISGVIASFLLLVTWELLLQGAETKAEVDARARINSQAREAYELLAHGGVASGGATGTDGSGEVQGLRAGDAGDTVFARVQSRLTATGNGLSLSNSQAPQMVIGCNGAGAPLPDCADASDTVTVDGWLAEAPAIDGATRSAGGITSETMITLTDPWQVQRRQRRPGTETETYRSIVGRFTEGAN